MPNQDQSISLILVSLVLGAVERDTPLATHYTTMSDENPPVRIPENEEGAAKIASEGEEDGVTEEQRDALAEIQARLIGDID